MLVHGPGQTHLLGSAHSQTVPGGGGHFLPSVHASGLHFPSRHGYPTGAGQSVGSTQSSGTQLALSLQDGGQKHPGGGGQVFGSVHGQST